MCEDEGDGKNFYRKKFLENCVLTLNKRCFSAMNVTMPINTNCEIEINVTIRAPTLFSVCQSSYYGMIFVVNFISLFGGYHRDYVRLF